MNGIVSNNRLGLVFIKRCNSTHSFSRLINKISSLSITFHCVSGVDQDGFDPDGSSIPKLQLGE